MSSMKGARVFLDGKGKNLHAINRMEMMNIHTNREHTIIVILFELSNTIKKTDPYQRKGKKKQGT